MSIAYLVERADTRLEDHVGVEEEGAQEWLRVAGQLGDDANQKQVDMQRVLQHVLQLRQDHTDEWTYREDTQCQGWLGIWDKSSYSCRITGATVTNHPGPGMSTQMLLPVNDS